MEAPVPVGTPQGQERRASTGLKLPEELLSFSRAAVLLLALDALDVRGVRRCGAASLERPTCTAQHADGGDMCVRETRLFELFS